MGVSKIIIKLIKLLLFNIMFIKLCVILEVMIFKFESFKKEALLSCVHCLNY